jgi:two-component system NarL family response regulator
MKDGKGIRILVVDDHPITRTGIAAILQSQPDMEACAQAGTVNDAVKLFGEHHPDLTLMDLRLRMVMVSRRSVSFARRALLPKS